MVGVTEWDTALTSLQTAFNIAKTMVDLRDARAFQAKVIEFQRAIMEAQSNAIAANTAHASLIDQVSALKTEMANLKAWDAEKQKYELQELGDGIVAYRMKPAMQCPEPEHAVCPDCYQASHISILQKLKCSPGRCTVQQSPHPEIRIVRRSFRKNLLAVIAPSTLQ